MAKRLKPAAKVVKAVGLKGDVKVYPLDARFEDYAETDFLLVGEGFHYYTFSFHSRGGDR